MLLLFAVLAGEVLSICPELLNRGGGVTWAGGTRVCDLTNCGVSMSLEFNGEASSKLFVTGGKLSKRSRLFKSNARNERMFGNVLAGKALSLLVEGVTNKFSKSDLFDFELVLSDLGGSLMTGSVETITSRGASAFLSGLGAVTAKAA